MKMVQNYVRPAVSVHHGRQVVITYVHPESIVQLQRRLKSHVRLGSIKTNEASLVVNYAKLVTTVTHSTVQLNQFCAKLVITVQLVQIFQFRVSQVIIIHQVVQFPSMLVFFVQKDIFVQILEWILKTTR